MKPLVIIPARGGSKGLPRKNILPLNGKPLILHTLEAAREVFEDDQIYVSTDDRDIANVVIESGLKVPFMRPAHLATDSATTLDVLKHAIRHYEVTNDCSPDIIVLLQPTSPLRNAMHIRSALEVYIKGIGMVMSVFETKSNPYYVLYEENDYGFLRKSKSSNITRRQDLPKVWEANGAIYIIKTSVIKNIDNLGEIDQWVPFEMDSYASIDIDDMLDFRFAEFVLQQS